MAVDRTDWMPVALGSSDKDEFVAAATRTAIDPDTGDEYDVVDYHLAAALAWEHYAAMGAGGAEQTSPDIQSVGTGDQSITYGGAASRQAAAVKRAAFHRARAHVRTVRIGGTVQMDPLPGRYAQAVEPDDEVA